MTGYHYASMKSDNKYGEWHGITNLVLLIVIYHLFNYAASVSA